MSLCGTDSDEVVKPKPTVKHDPGTKITPNSSQERAVGPPGAFRAGPPWVGDRSGAGVVGLQAEVERGRRQLLDAGGLDLWCPTVLGRDHRERVVAVVEPQRVVAVGV